MLRHQRVAYAGTVEYCWWRCTCRAGALPNLERNRLAASRVVPATAGESQPIAIWTWGKVRSQVRFQRCFLQNDPRHIRVGDCAAGIKLKPPLVLPLATARAKRGCQLGQLKPYTTSDNALASQYPV
jgi:hypothetical protein